MFIQTEPTPNPMTMKFLPGREVLSEGSKFYTSRKSAEESPLAEILFEIDGVNAVFLGAEFITITKRDNVEWSVIKADILTTIMDHFVANQPVLRDQAGVGESVAAVSDAPVSEEDEKIIVQIKELIETRVRPAVAQDGGDIIFHSFTEGVVKLEMRGACSGCPSSTITLKNGIENMLKHYIPEVEAVEAA